MQSRLTISACLFALAVGAPAAGGASTLETEWRRARPEERGLDAKALQELTRVVEAGDSYPEIHGLLIVRNGDLIYEEYFDGWSADRPHMLQSVTKSFTSALVGIAIGEGAIAGVDEKILGFFPDLQGIRHLDARKRAITLEDLLTMRGGTDYHERGSGSPHSELNQLPRGWDRFYLDRPMIHDPGSTFSYDSGGVILMSSLIKARTGLHADAYAEKKLFEPLGIESARWFRNSEGHPHTGGGLDLRPRDMAKLGQLYLQEGRWGDRQIVPAEWVRTSTRRHVERRRGHNVGYGYLWWIHEPDPLGNGQTDIYAAHGFRGQYIFVVPEHDLVVVVSAGTHRYSDEVRPIDLLYDRILPSIRAP